MMFYASIGAPRGKQWFKFKPFSIGNVGAAVRMARYGIVNDALTTFSATGGGYAIMEVNMLGLICGKLVWILVSVEGDQRQAGDITIGTRFRRMERNARFPSGYRPTNSSACVCASADIDCATHFLASPLRVDLELPQNPKWK